MIPQIKGVTIPARYLGEYVTACHDESVPPLLSHKGEWATIIKVTQETQDDLIVDVRDASYQRDDKTVKALNEPVSVAVYEKVEVLR